MFNAPCNLLKEAGPWVARLVQLCDPKLKATMSATCKEMEQLVLTGRGVTVTVCVRNESSPKAIHSLIAPCQYAKSIKLVLDAGPTPEQSTGAVANPRMDFDRAMQLLENVKQARGDRSLSNVAEVVFKGVHTDALLPPRLKNTCPKVTSITYRGANLTLPPQPLPAAPNTTLTHLALRAPTDTASTAALIQHLLHFQALEQLRITSPATPPVLRQLMDNPEVRQRMTTLAVSTANINSGVVLEMLAWLPALHELWAPHLVVDDQLMSALLQHPTLRALAVRSLDLTQDYSKSPCQWGHLSVRYLDITRLPLHSLTQLTIRPRAECGLYITTCLDQAKRDQLQRIGWPTWDYSQQLEYNELADVLAPLRALIAGQGVSATVSVLCVSVGPAQDITDTLQLLMSNYQPVTDVTNLVADMSHTAAPDVLRVLQQLNAVATNSKRSDHNWALQLTFTTIPQQVRSKLLFSLPAYTNVKITCTDMVLTEETVSELVATAHGAPRVMITGSGPLQAAPGWEERSSIAATDAANEAAQPPGAAEHVRLGPGTKWRQVVTSADSTSILVTAYRVDVEQELQQEIARMNCRRRQERVAWLAVCLLLFAMLALLLLGGRV